MNPSTTEFDGQRILAELAKAEKAKSTLASRREGGIIGILVGAMTAGLTSYLLNGTSFQDKAVGFIGGLACSVVLISIEQWHQRRRLDAVIELVNQLNRAKQ